MKILYITTIAGTMNFFKNFIKELIDEGHTVDIATNITKSKIADCYNEWGCKVYPLSCSRSPLAMSNIVAINEIKKLVSDNKYDIVHCHTPIAAMCTRLACCKARKNGTRVFYTAHGFHFYKGAPLKNWLLYYPVEKICAHFTDVLVTINHEDYAISTKKMKAKKVVYVPGVGIDINKFANETVDRASIRKELGIPDGAVLMLSVGELIKRKNHETVIRAIANIENIYYVIAGKGGLCEYLQNMINELGLSDRVKLLGYRNDIGKLCKAADICTLPSFHEGLPVALMEAMASGLPVICSRIRGNTDLIDENGGTLFAPQSEEECIVAIKKLLEMDLISVGNYNREKVKQFEIGNVNRLMKELYELSL